MFLRVERTVVQIRNTITVTVPRNPVLLVQVQVPYRYQYKLVVLAGSSSKLHVVVPVKNVNVIQKYQLKHKNLTYRARLLRRENAVYTKLHQFL